jgi:hypothetical protein
MEMASFMVRSKRAAAMLKSYFASARSTLAHM